MEDANIGTDSILVLGYENNQICDKVFWEYIFLIVKHVEEHMQVNQYGIHFGGQGPYGTGGVHIVILHGD
ncbi:hypothetical protein K0M31_016067 [Melipona bicolor]|uniref:Uncharacterized protein n=1 Tax=Melipona bicolor TaxID=60889 RepID=A0AA40G6C6_9HYME|nr:hypothetical protein K0M31_016067 [Melipona bicolor]